ncbi:hypothetical protein ACODT5_06755 [Streptomyces sp. 5.8]|uniref:hypothetical protein n=1 Tax=Streptomyces sp. 5.8 TaxID=3406571 RepID=UPI003BB588E3
MAAWGSAHQSGNLDVQGRDFAESVYRLHSGPAGNLPESFVNTPEGIELLNKHLQALPQGQLIMEHFSNRF